MYFIYFIHLMYCIFFIHLITHNNINNTRGRARSARLLVLLALAALVVMCDEVNTGEEEKRGTGSRREKDGRWEDGGWGMGTTENKSDSF